MGKGALNGSISDFTLSRLPWDTWIHDLRLAVGAFLGFQVQKLPKFWGEKFSIKKIALSQNFFDSSPKNPGIPGWLPYVYYIIQLKNQDFTTTHPPRRPNFQIWSKTAKLAKKPWKWHLLDGLRPFCKNFSKNLPTDQFSHHSKHKKSVFGHFENFSDFTWKKWPNPKSGPFDHIWGPKTWSWSLFII